MTSFTYKASTSTPDFPPPDCNMTQEEWKQLSPGYRREIWRGYKRVEAVKKYQGLIQDLTK